MIETVNWLVWLLLTLYLILLIFWLGFVLIRKIRVAPQKNLKRFFIVLHAIMLPSLFFAYVIVKKPFIQFFLFNALIIWVVLALLTPLFYLLILRNSLPSKKEHALLLFKERQVESGLWLNGYRSTHVHLILTFEFDNGARKGIHVSWKVYNSFQGGETGTLIYKDSGKYLFFVDFIKD